LKPKTLAEKLQEQVDKMNRRTEQNAVLYAQACREQGVEVGQPVDVMAFVNKERKHK